MLHVFLILFFIFAIAIVLSAMKKFQKTTLQTAIISVSLIGIIICILGIVATLIFKFIF